MNFPAVIVGVALLFGAALFWFMRTPQSTVSPELLETERNELRHVDAPALLVKKKGYDDEPETYFLPKRVDPNEGKPVPCSFVGSVVDVESNPIVDAAVTVKFQGKVLEQVTTNDKGQYVFTAKMIRGGGPFRSGTVVAEGPEGRVGHEVFDAPSFGDDFERVIDGRIQIMPIQLRTGTCSLDITVRSECEGGLPARVWITRKRGAGSEIIEWTDAAGHLHVDGLKTGGFQVVAASEGCGRASSIARVTKSENVQVELTLPESRTLTVEVVERGTHKPVEGARVMVALSEMPTTIHFGDRLIPVSPMHLVNAEGRALIDGLGTTETVSIRVIAEDYPQMDSTLGLVGSARVVVQPDQTSVRIELDPQRTIRWPIHDAGYGIPSAGADVRLQAHEPGRSKAPPEFGIIEDGHLVVKGWHPGSVLAQAHIRGFGAALIQAVDGANEGESIAFYPFRSITLTAKNGDGSPAVGIVFQIRREGAIGRVPHAVADEQGIAVIDGLFGGIGAKAECFVSRTSWYHKPEGKPIETVNLEDQDARISFTFPGARALRVEFRIDGESPPSDLAGTIRASTRSSSPRQGATTLGVSPFGKTIPIQLDSNGSQVVHCLPDIGDDVVSVSVRCPGYSQSKASSVPLGTLSPVPLVVELRKIYSVLVNIVPSSDAGFGAGRIGLIEFDKSKGEWPKVSSDTSYALFRHGGSRSAGSERKLQVYRAGTFRVVEHQTGVMSIPFQVGPGLEPPKVTLDLSSVGTIRGRVIVPQGANLALARIQVSGRTFASSAGTTIRGDNPHLSGYFVIGKTGAFSVPVQRGEEVTLRVRHPSLRPHSSQGTATVKGPRSGVELQLVNGPKTTLRFDKSLDLQLKSRGLSLVNLNQGRSTSVHRTRTHVAVRLTPQGGGPFIETVGKIIDNGKAIVIGGYEPGAYALWVNTPPFAPLVLPRVVLGEGDVELGPHSLGDGSSLGIQVQGRNEGDIRLVWVHVTALDGQTYLRTAKGAGRVVSVSGIGPGRFQVYASMPLSDVRELNEVIEFDGKTDVERVIDLR